MEFTTVGEINEYRSESINPLLEPDTVFEVYSVPIYDTGHPEYLSGKEIGSTKQIVQKDDILLCKINPRINRVWIVSDESDQRNIASSEWIVIRNHSYNPQYLAWYFRSEVFKSLMISEVTGIGGSLTRAQPKRVATYPVPVLDRQEQDGIVERLNRLHSVIQYRKRQIQGLDQLIKARFVEMFGDYQDIVQLSDVAEVTGGLTKNGNRDRLPLKLPYLRVANVSFASIDTTEMLSIGLTEEERSKTTLQYGDLLFVEGNGSPDQIGRVAIWHDEVVPCVHQNHIIKARLNESKMLPAFAMHYYMSQKGRDQIKKKAVSTSGLYTLSVSKISGFVMPCPPLDRQIEFAALVAQVDKSKVVEFSVFTKRAKSYII